MAVLTVRNVPEEIHRALRARAAQHGQSTEAEVRKILADAVRPQGSLRLGDALADLGRSFGLSNDDVEALNKGKNTAAAVPMSLE